MAVQIGKGIDGLGPRSECHGGGIVRLATAPPVVLRHKIRIARGADDFLHHALAVHDEKLQGVHEFPGDGRTVTPVSPGLHITRSPYL